MLRQHQRKIDIFHIFVSGLLIILTYKATHQFFFGFAQLVAFSRYLPQILVFVFILTLTLYNRRFSVSGRFITNFVIFREILNAYGFSLMGYGFYVYLTKSEHLSRIYLLGGLAVSFFTVLFWYYCVHWFLCQARIRNLNYRNTLIIADSFAITDIFNLLKDHKFLGLHVIGVMGLEDEKIKVPSGAKYFGTVQDLPNTLNAEIVDYVVIGAYRKNPIAAEQALLTCVERGIEVWLKPDFMQTKFSRIDYLQETPLFVFTSGSKYGITIGIKRMIDVLISGLLLLILAFPMLLVAFLVKRTSPGPVFFSQKRMGLNGRRFFIYKFRTMHKDAEERKSQYQLKNEMRGPTFKMKDDPRVTPMGRWLRRFSIDELPQLWNVFIGDMSLVGPRPPIPTEVSLYKGWHRRRLSMRPGITCIWQVTGRNKITDFDEWTKLDLKYIDEWSLWLDLKILFKTIPAVFTGTGV